MGVPGALSTSALLGVSLTLFALLTPFGASLEVVCHLGEIRLRVVQPVIAFLGHYVRLRTE